MVVNCDEGSDRAGGVVTIEQVAKGSPEMWLLTAATHRKPSASWDLQHGSCLWSLLPDRMGRLQFPLTTRFRRCHGRRPGLFPADDGVPCDPIKSRPMSGRSHRRSYQTSRHSTKRTQVPRAARRRAVVPRKAIKLEKLGEPFCPPERWHEPVGRRRIEILTEPAGRGYIHPVTAHEVAERIELLPARLREPVEVVQLSRMTRKRARMPLYGLQWGQTVYLYPIEESLVETYARPPLPSQQVEAKMFGGRWYEDNGLWHLEWTLPALKDFYLNNILIHEIGHVNDTRNRNSADRERFAEWFAIEYGYRASRQRR